MKSYNCNTCNFKCTTKQHYQSHINSKKHIEKCENVSTADENENVSVYSTTSFTSSYNNQSKQSIKETQQPIYDTIL